MATTQAVSKPARLIPRLKAAKRGAVLINQVHQKLYPHLYDENGRRKDLPENPQAERSYASQWSTRRSTRRSTSEKGLEQYIKEFKNKRWENAIAHTKNLIIYPPKQKPISKVCSDPVSLVSDAQIKRLDPTGARTRLFAKTNPERAQVGDILLVRQRTGEPFAGVCINIRRRGVDTAILLRGQLTRVGVEMWFKVYSPLVEGIEVVQRAAKRARRARLTYMRLPKHDRGSVENVVRVYMRQKAALGTADGKKKGAMAGMGGKKGGNKRGNKRR